MIMKYRLIAALAITITMPVTVYAVEAHHQPAAAGAEGTAAMADGEVRRVDKDTRKITIKHGPISSLGMPPMTMVFQVQDPAMLDQVKAGDKIKFNADKVGGAYMVKKIEIAK
jgi:Cu(I)/Ag(I) efflux system periplasmic protein CusF